MTRIPFFDTPAALAMRIGQLATTLYDQMDHSLAAHGVKLPGYTTSIVQTLYHAGPQSISDLALELALSHQLASQRVKWLVAAGFASVTTGTRDRRTRLVRLTRTGRAEGDKLQRFLPAMERAYRDLFSELGHDLHAAALNASAALAERPLDLRIDRAAAARPAAAGTSRKDGAS